MSALNDLYPQPAALPDGAAGAEVIAGLAVQVGRIARTVEQLRAAQADMSRLRFAPIQPIIGTVAGGNLTLGNAETWGPKTGYFWAVQRISAFGLAGADVLSVYRGQPSPQNFLNSLIVSSPEWRPGRTSLVLQPGDQLTAQGTGLTAASVAVNFDVIIGVLDLLPRYLI
jgi:hypothetical protein